MHLKANVVFALALVLALNYVDRSSLATAAPLIQKEFGLTNGQLGFLLSAFFWVYTPAQLLGGWLVHRYDVRVVLGAGVFLWGCATAMTGLAGGFISIFVLRLLLALGECVTFPSIQLIVSRNTTIEERGRVSSLISSGQGFGPMLGTLFGGAGDGGRPRAKSWPAVLRMRRVLPSLISRFCSGVSFGAWLWVCSRSTMRSTLSSFGCLRIWFKREGSGFRTWLALWRRFMASTR